ncbi:MarR family winged helix-turn-helix transcriptional regulator [Microbacterium sp. 22242]|uniref:MarR family winged helix-turn-helix transcriptional regulator n=1 Tax=Microbacterium sp. 22242 TaxID=3453896 RepID=UPI003F8529FA
MALTVHTGYLIRRAQQRHVALWSRIVSTETTSVQFSILSILAGRGETSQRELCDAVDLDRSTIADLVRRMQRRDLLSRRRSAADARRNVVALTDLGRSELDRLRPRVDDLEAALTAGISPSELAQLHHGLNRILDAPETEVAGLRGSGSARAGHDGVEA